MLKAILATLFVTLSSFANCNLELLEKQPILAGGRVKPLYVHAQESVKFISGKSSLDQLSALDVYCNLSLDTTSIEHTKINLPILIEHIEAKELLNLDIEKTQFEASKVIAQKDFIRAKIMQMKASTPLKKELTKLWSRINLYEQINAGIDFKFSIPSANEINWVSLSQIEPKPATFEELNTIILESTNSYIQLNGDDYQLELTLFKSHIFMIAMLLVIMSIFLTVLLKNPKLGVSFAIVSILVQIAGITMRVMISGRAPITNMYETVMFSGLGALIISLFIMIYKKDKLFLLSGLGYNVLCLFMMRFANNMLDESISPLVPVLRDNFWLSTHVTTIILSYAALALSWILANIILFKSMKGPIDKKNQRYYENLINTCVIVGVTLLVAGIILGGVWADYSWGRFWGWDPKETWSLIVFLFYITLLHGRYTNWLNPKRFIMSVAGGFMTVMMAWFGVNYILATGLHSYGFSEGGAIFLGSFFLVQSLFLIITGFKFGAKNEKALS